MRRGRIRAAALAIAALVANAPAALAVGRCPSEADQQLFEMTALKTELMVAATACHQEDKYNAFIIRFRPQLTEADRAIMRYFSSHRRNWDSYITAMANGRADVAQSVGSDYCPRTQLMYNEVMAVAPADIRAYAAGKDLIPAVPGGCTAAAATTGRAAATPSRRR